MKASSWRHEVKKHGVSMSFAKVEIYIDSIAGPWLLPPTFFTRWYMLDWMNLILTSLSTSCSGGYIEGCSEKDFFCTFPSFHNIRMFPFQAQNTLLFLQSDRAMCPHCQVSKKIFLRISDHFTLFTFECMLFQHGCSRFQFPAWLWGKGVHVIISDQKRILSPEEIEHCLIL